MGSKGNIKSKDYKSILISFIEEKDSQYIKGFEKEITKFIDEVLNRYYSPKVLYFFKKFDLLKMLLMEYKNIEVNFFLLTIIALPFYVYLSEKYLRRCSQRVERLGKEEVAYCNVEESRLIIYIILKDLVVFEEELITDKIVIENLPVLSDYSELKEVLCVQV